MKSDLPSVAVADIPPLKFSIRVQYSNSKKPSGACCPIEGFQSSIGSLDLAEKHKYYHQMARLSATLSEVDVISYTYNEQYCIRAFSLLSLGGGGGGGAVFREYGKASGLLGRVSTTCTVYADSAERRILSYFTSV